MGEDWDASAEAWIAFVETNVSRTHLLDGVMLEEAGDVSGLSACDIGCGEGRFSRMLASRGASVFGIDPTLPFLRHGDLLGGGPSYLRGNGETLPIKTASIDLCVSYVSLIDIPDYRVAIREMARVLKPRGRALIANLNPFMTTFPRAWKDDEEGNPMYVRVDDYFRERPLEVSWCGIEVINWHRPLSSYFDALLESGLTLRQYLEPKPTDQAMREASGLAGAERVPFFHVMVWEKSD